MGQKTKQIILWLGIVILTIIFTPFFGGLYDKYFIVSSGFFGPPHPEYLNGFFIAFVLFISLLLPIFGNKSKYKILGILIVIILAFDFLASAGEDLIIDLCAAIVGFIIAQGVLLIYKPKK